MTPAELIHHAVLTLAGQCDGAVTRDAVGYAAQDVRFSHRLAATPLGAWSTAMVYAAHDMLRKYRSQLAQAGVDYDAIPKPAPVAAVGTERQGRSDARHVARGQAPTPPPQARTVTLVPGRHFEVRFEYHEAVVAYVRALPGAAWQKGGQYWRVGLTAIAAPKIRELIQRFRFAAGDGVLEATHEAERQAEELVEASSASTADLVIPGLGGTPYPFQLAGVAYAMRAKRCWIGDQVGLGKTIMALATLQALNAFPALVVCTASTKLNWAREARKWLPGKVVAVLDGRPNRYLSMAHVIVVNYDLLPDRAKERQLTVEQEVRLKELTRKGDRPETVAALRAKMLAEPALRSDLKDIHPQLKALILDESQRCKNGKAQRTKLCRALADGIGVRLLLTGTAVMNRPDELVSQLAIMGRLEEFGGYRQFTNRYCGAHRTRFGNDTSGARFLDELNGRMRASCYIRRLKVDVAPELPPQRVCTVPLEIDNRTEYEAAKKDVVKWLGERASKDREFRASIAELPAEEREERIHEHVTAVEEKAARAETLVKINALKRLAARGKLRGAIEWMDDFLESGEKLLCFANHRDIVDAVGQHFRAPQLHGGTSSVERQAMIDRFQRDPSVRLMALNMVAGGEGITLTAASNVVHLELAWTPSAHDQATGRVHRIGQTADQVTSWYLLAHNTIDMDIAELLEAKRQVVTQVLDGVAPDEESSILKDLVARLTGDAPAVSDEDPFELLAGPAPTRPERASPERASPGRASLVHARQEELPW